MNLEIDCYIEVAESRTRVLHMTEYMTMILSIDQVHMESNSPIKTVNQIHKNQHSSIKSWAAIQDLKVVPILQEFWARSPIM